MSIGQLVAKLAETNCKLWHEEDRARANDYADAKDVKRSIDRLNQQRNDLIEAIDAEAIRLTRTVSYLPEPHVRG